METTVLIALYGAALSTIVAGWSFYQWWRSGPKLVCSVEPNSTGQRSVYEPRRDNDIRLSIFNRGDSETTIINVCIQSFSGRLRYLCRRYSTCLIPGDRYSGDALPFRIAPGGTFQCWVAQDGLAEQSHNQRLYFCISHSMADRRVFVRVQPFEDKSIEGKRQGILTV